MSRRARRFRWVAAGTILAACAVLPKAPPALANHDVRPSSQPTLHEIVESASDYESPSLSPDGKQVAFVRFRDPDDQIWVMDIDGTHQRQVTKKPGLNDDPAWSPDGKRITFERGPSSIDNPAPTEIYVINSDGTNEHPLTHSPQRVESDYPRWSPNGQQVVFTRGNHDIVGALWVMNSDGSKQRRLKGTADASDITPDWSKDGKKIVFSRILHKTTSIWVMNADGSNQHQLTHSSGPDAGPRWSPNGRTIVFESYRNASEDIYTMNADGSHPRRLTHDSHAAYPAWSADGKTIAYERNVGLTTPAQIWLMNADGSKQHRLSR